MAHRKPIAIKEQAKKLLLRPYSRVLIPQDEGGFTAEIVEFPGCFAEGETPEEAYANLERTALSWLFALLEKGEQAPAPLTNYEISGRFALRLPKSLYARAAKYAAREGVSLNQFIVNAVAEQLGEARAMDRVETILSNAMWPTVIVPAFHAHAEGMSWSLGPQPVLQHDLRIAETADTTETYGRRN